MVAQKRGRGAKNQAAKGKAAAAEESQPEAAPAEAAAAAEVAEPTEPAAEDNNGVAEGAEHEEAAEAGAEGGAAADGASAPAAPAADGEAPSEPEEKKVEPGRLLVENLPSSCLFDYQDKLKEIFAKYGEVTSIKRGPIIVTELTTTPTLSAIVEFKNKESLEKAAGEDGAAVDGACVRVSRDVSSERAVLVGAPHEAQLDYVRLLFQQCGPVAHVHDYVKGKYKIIRVTFENSESVEKALKLDRELRINGFLVTVSRFRDDDDAKQALANVNKNKRPHGGGQQNRNSMGGGGGAPAGAGAGAGAGAAGGSPNGNRNYRGGRGAYNARGNFRGGRGAGGGGGGGGRGGFGRGGAFPRGFGPVNAYMPPQGFMARPGGFMDGQRPNKRLRQM